MNNQRKLLELLELADSYKEKNDLENVIKCYQECIKIEGSRTILYLALGDAVVNLHGYEKAEEYFLTAYKMEPANQNAILYLIKTYKSLNQFDKVDKLYKELIAINPNHGNLFNYGCFLIKRGELLRGHELFTNRAYIKEERVNYPDLPEEKKWDYKTDISKKTLLIHFEHGFGDTIMYSRFAPMMRKFAGKVIFFVQKELESLFKDSPVINNGIEIVSNENDIYSINYDYHMPLMDCAYPLKIEKCTMPYKEGYIKPKIIDSSTFPQDKLKIGIAYSGNIKSNYAVRDIELEKFEKITKIPNVQLYSLQYGEEHEYSWLNNIGKNFRDFTDTAAAINNMDLIISTDNVVLNLAGAIGKKTIGLFTKGNNYRWYELSGKDVGWYSSVKPYILKINDNIENIPMIYHE